MLNYKHALIRFFSLLLILTILFTALPQNINTVFASSSLKGDVTGDGVIDGRDALKIMRIVQGLDIATLDEIERGDVYPLPGSDGRIMGDGQLTIEDASKILRYSVGLSYHPGK